MHTPDSHTAHPAKEILFRICFQVIPTFLVALYMLWLANIHLSLLRGQHWNQSLAFGAGMILAIVLYQSKIRFIPTFIALIIVGWLVAQGLKNFVTGDVESFFLAHQFYVFFVVFCVGWLVAYGLSRLRFGSVCMAIVFVGISIYLASFIHTTLENVSFLRFLVLLIPVVVYGVYIIFISEQIRGYQLFGNGTFGGLFLKAFLFNVVAGGCAILVLAIFKTEIQTTLTRIQEGTYKEQNSMLQKNEDGSSIKNSTSMSGSNNRKKELMMLAYIDNFFQDSEVPNPLYLVTFYYAQFDTATETFLETTDMPDKDLYRPDVSKVPLYHTAYDSSVLEFGKNNKLTKTVEIEVYNKAMSNATFVAPSTAFFVQPIAVEKEFQSEYKSAYRAKSVVSDLNSAYFVYNVNKEEIRAFQQTRFKVLESLRDFSSMDSAVYAYYTDMPEIESLQQVKDLAADISKDLNSPIEKVVAVRDYFLKKDANGKPLFKYSDNPGIPDIPSASKLNYFLFQNRKGYCAHYAGATLFLLRSMGIPARITAGFLTEDRSTANPGWYYFYADQVHAWVQVYFPGFGWLDFDTTVGNEDARESEQPDATPPLQPSKASLAISGYITAVDTQRHTISVASKATMALDVNYESIEAIEIQLDVSIARIIKDTSALSIQQLKVNDTITAITYGKGVVNNPPSKSVLKDLVKTLPEPVPVDHIQIRPLSHKVNIDKVNTEKEASSNWKWIVLIISILIIGFAIIQSIPMMIRAYYFRKSKSQHLPKSAYYQYVGALYYLWMLRIRKKDGETSLQFAQRVDAKYQTKFSAFMNVYLKMKYSSTHLNAQESKMAQSFLKPFTETIASHFSKKERRKRWLYVKPALQFAWFKKVL